MTEDKQNKNDSSQDNNHRLSPANIIEQNETRLLIWGLLNIYPELSFSELARKLGKSKSTLFPHLQKLIDVGLVQIAKEKKVRGSIPAKYYSLVPEALEKTVFTTIDSSEGIDEEVSQLIINKGKATIDYSKRILEMGLRFWDTLENLDDSEKVIEILNNLPTKKYEDVIKHGKFMHTRFFLTEDQYRKWVELYFDLAIKFDLEISKEYAENPNVDRPYYFFAFILPIKLYIETLGSKIK